MCVGLYAVRCSTKRVLCTCGVLMMCVWFAWLLYGHCGDYHDDDHNAFAEAFDAAHGGLFPGYFLCSWCMPLEQGASCDYYQNLVIILGVPCVNSPFPLPAPTPSPHPPPPTPYPFRPNSRSPAATPTRGDGPWSNTTRSCARCACVYALKPAASNDHTQAPTTSQTAEFTTQSSGDTIILF